MSVYNVTYINRGKKVQMVPTELTNSIKEIDRFFLSIEGVTGVIIEEPEVIVIEKVRES